MLTDQNKARVKRLLEEGLNKGNESVIDELIAPNYVSTEEGMSMAGPEGFKAMAAGFRMAFPDAHLIIQDIIAEGDTVVTWAVFKGTHEGPLEGLPPTGRQVEVKDVDLWRLEHGKVVGTRTHFDRLGMMHQLGVLGGMAEGEK
jgi:steroid delta-isomerase-like uncharacterized protein